MKRSRESLISTISAEAMEQICGVKNSLRITKTNAFRDYLFRTTQFDWTADGNTRSLTISPFPKCCGIRVIQDLGLHEPDWNFEKTLPFMMAIDAFANYPGRYMFAVPGRNYKIKEQKDFVADASSDGIYRTITKICNTVPTYSVNPVMGSVIEVREFQFEITKLDGIPLFEPFADVVSRIHADPTGEFKNA